MDTLLFPLQFDRQFAGPLDKYMSFDTYADMQAFLTSPLRFSGQIVTCKDTSGIFYQLNAAMTIWEAKGFDYLTMVANLYVKYGLLYNYYAVSDARNLSNTGWHVPTKAEWDTLVAYCGVNPGDKVKEAGTNYWTAPNSYATNEYNFNARGSGQRYSFSTFSYLNDNATWLCADLYNISSAQTAQVSPTTHWFSTSGLFDLKTGHGVRLVKDATTLTHGQTGTYTGNDGRIYPTICIGTQEFISCNLSETLYRNGNTIPNVMDQTAWNSLTTGAVCFYNNDINNALGYPYAFNLYNKGLLEFQAGSGIVIGIENGRLIITNNLPATKPIQVPSLTLLSASWSLVSGLYEYNLSNVNILSTSIVEVIPDNADIATVQTAQIYPKTVSSAGVVKLYAKNAPIANIGVTINIL